MFKLSVFKQNEKKRRGEGGEFVADSLWSQSMANKERQVE